MRDLNGIITYLKTLDDDHCVSLGGEFGLHYPNLKRMQHNRSDIVAAWLRREDDVTNKCRPTWSNLAFALECIHQNGIAESVRKDHLANT